MLNFNDVVKMKSFFIGKYEIKLPIIQGGMGVGVSSVSYTHLDTRLDRGFLFNALGGKEWIWGKSRQHIFNTNIRLSYQGGDHYTPVDKAASLEEKDIIFNETQAFSKQFSPAFNIDLGISYKLNTKRVSHEFGLQLLNLTGYTGQHGYQYNEQKNIIEKKNVSDILPNPVSYTHLARGEPAGTTLRDQRRVPHADVYKRQKMSCNTCRNSPTCHPYPVTATAC